MTKKEKLMTKKATAMEMISMKTNRRIDNALE